MASLFPCGREIYVAKSSFAAAIGDVASDGEAS